MQKRRSKHVTTFMISTECNAKYTKYKGVKCCLLKIFLFAPHSQRDKGHRNLRPRINSQHWPLLAVQYRGPGKIIRHQLRKLENLIWLPRHILWATMLPPAAAVAAAPAPASRCENNLQLEYNWSHHQAGEPFQGRSWWLPGLLLPLGQLPLLPHWSPLKLRTECWMFTKYLVFIMFILSRDRLIYRYIPPLQLFLHGATTWYLSVSLQSFLSGSYVISNASSSCFNDGHIPIDSMSKA